MLSDFHALCADFEATTISKRRPLEIWVFSLVACWVELGSANTVRVVTYNNGSFSASWT